MIKAVLFDLDGVLFSSKEIHFEALNQALAEISEVYKITYDEHLTVYDGLPTKRKLELLAEKCSLPYNYFSSVNKRKQEITRQMLRNQVRPDKNKVELFEKLYKEKIKTAVVSNATLDTVHYVLYNLGFDNMCNYPELRVANDSDAQITLNKPHPQMYMFTMMKLGVSPDEVLILEDSPKGLEAAKRSGAHIMAIRSPAEVTYENIKKRINEINNSTQLEVPKSKIWTQDNLNIVIPMAGEGSRFKERFSFPKPLVDVLTKPLIAWALESLKCEANYIFLVRAEHLKQFNTESMLKFLTKGRYKIVPVDRVTEGAACTVLLAKDLINNSDPLVISNCDQFYDTDMADFYYKNLNNPKIDGSILTFPSTHPKWSYVQKSDQGFVERVAEKEVISNEATVGVYAFRHGKDFVWAAEKMIADNKRVKGEFYVAPCINELIQEKGHLFTTHPVQKFYGLGDVESVEYFINNYNWN